MKDQTKHYQAVQYLLDALETRRAIRNGLLRVSVQCDDPVLVKLVKQLIDVFDNTGTDTRQTQLRRMNSCRDLARGIERYLMGQMTTYEKTGDEG